MNVSIKGDRLTIHILKYMCVHTSMEVCVLLSVKSKFVFETLDLKRDIMKKVQEWKTTKNQGHHRISDERGERHRII